jgi:hypothetical protein
VTNRAKGEGCFLWALLIATPLVLILGSSAVRRQFADYWGAVLIYFSIVGAIWVAIWISRLVGNVRRKKGEKSQNDLA